jgi:hypothetical protein
MPGLRPDHLLLSPIGAARLADAGVDRNVRGEDGASDHAPAWIRLGQAKGRGRDSLARLEAKRDIAPPRRAPSHR